MKTHRPAVPVDSSALQGEAQTEGVIFPLKSVPDILARLLSGVSNCTCTVRSALSAYSHERYRQAGRQFKSSVSLDGARLTGTVLTISVPALHSIHNSGLPSCSAIQSHTKPHALCIVVLRNLFFCNTHEHFRIIGNTVFRAPGTLSSGNRELRKRQAPRTLQLHGSGNIVLRAPGT